MDNIIELDKIYSEDCLEGLKRIQDDSIDCMITSPPYNVGIDYGDKYNDNQPFNEYLSFIKEVMTEVYRVLKNGGRAIINIANTGRKPYIPLSSYINMIMIEIGFLCRGEIVWDKGASVGVSCAWGSWKSPSNPSLRDVHEYILVFSKGDYKHVVKNGEPTISSEEFVESTKSIWHMQTENAKKIGHPAPFPLSLPAKLINLYTFKGDIILDPFIGSGTTAIAAIRRNRHFIGFETNSDYFKIALERIEKELQPKLF